MFCYKCNEMIDLQVACIMFKKAPIQNNIKPIVAL